MLHNMWGKVLVISELSKLSALKQPKIIKKESYDVSISNPKIFKELQELFKYIGGYKSLYIKLFEDMSEFKFDSSSSVTDDDGYESTYGETNLHDHTINCLKEMILIIQNNESYENDKDIYYLLALLHDFGKSKTLCARHGINIKKNKHFKRSAEYFSKIVKENITQFQLDETSYSIILNTLKVHHNIVDVDYNNLFLSTLKKADGAARRYELHNRLKENKS